MTNSLVPPNKSLGYSDIYLDFIAGSKAAGDFYLSSDPAQVVSELDKITYDREKMADILIRQNKAFGCGQLTLDNIELLKGSETLCVFTGQQAGLLGGPMLVFNKAIGIIKAARHYSVKLNRRVIPIFWIAGDDHDFEEANHTWLLDRAGQTVNVRYDSTPELELPTSEQMLSSAEALNSIKEMVADTLGQSDFTDNLYKLIDDSYTTNDTLVSGFGKFMTALLGKHGLIFFNPGDKEVKQHAASFFTKIIKQGMPLRDLFLKTNQSIADHGYHIQVEKKDSATHLFYNNNGRRPVVFENESYEAGDESFTQAELLALIDKYPERFSPDVMARPVFQSFLFPVLSQKGGPAEIAYLAQLNPAFELFDLIPPLHKARPTSTLIEKRFEKIMTDYQISFEELTGDIETVVNKVLATSFPSDIEARFNKLRHEVEDRFNNFTEETLKFDGSLEKFGKQTFGKIDFAMKAFEGKVFSSHKKKSQDVRDRIYRLEHALFTNRAIQERSLNIVSFMAKYGPGVIDFMFQQLDSEEASHQLIYLSEMSN